jgi:hypothetical protein
MCGTLSPKTFARVRLVCIIEPHYRGEDGPLPENERADARQGICWKGAARESGDRALEVAPGAAVERGAMAGG